MSSILDALEKLESPPPPAAPGGPPPRPNRRRFVVAAGVVTAFLAGLGIAAWLLRSPAAPSAPVVASAPEPTPPPTAAPATTLPARTPVARERPWVEVVEDTPGVVDHPRTAPAPPSPPHLPPDAAATPVAPAPRVERAAPVAVPVAPTSPPSPSAPPAAAATVPRPAEPAARPTPRPAGAPDVRVSFLIYSRTPARRSVALSIDGAGLLTLREGQTAHGLEVVEILPDGAQLAWEGARFTVPARN
jgi:hypothetical protein